MTGLRIVPSHFNLRPIFRKSASDILTAQAHPLIVVDVLEAEQMIAGFALRYSSAELVGGIEERPIVDDDLLAFDVDADLQVIYFALLQTEEAIDGVVGNRQLQTLERLLFGVNADRSKAFVKPNLGKLPFGVGHRRWSVFRFQVRFVTGQSSVFLKITSRATR